MRTTKNSLYGGLLGVAALGLGACQGLVEDINNDPNNFTDVTLELSLNQAGLATGAISNQQTARIATIFSDQFVGSDRQFIALNSYSAVGATFDNSWEDIYQRGLVAAQIARDQAQEQGLTALDGAAQIFEAYYFAEAAALFGDVPFSEANQIEQFEDPALEPQADVLRGVISMLDEAIGKVGDRAVAADFTGIFVGDLTYAQLANGLKARYALYLMDYAGAAEFAAAAEMDTEGESLRIRTSTANYGENLWYQFEVEQRSDYISIGESTLFQILADSTERTRANDKTDDDARLAYFNSGVSGGINRINTVDGFGAIAEPLDVITAREVQLILAESLARTGDTEGAIAALNTARNIWEAKLGLGDDVYEDYEADDFEEDGIAATAGETAANSLLLEILEEKFVSVIGTPSYYDVLRTDNLLGVRIKGTGTTMIPQRFLYPQTERSSNSSLPEELPGLFEPLPLYR